MALMALYSSYGSYGFLWLLMALMALMAPYGSYGFLWLLWLSLNARCAFRSRAAPGLTRRQWAKGTAN